MFQKSFNFTFLLDFSDISSETCLNTMDFLVPLCWQNFFVQQNLCMNLCVHVIYQFMSYWDRNWLYITYCRMKQ